MRRLVVGALAFAACGDNAVLDPPSLPSSPANPPRDQYYQWLKVEPPGAVCGNGSQFKFFVNFSPDSDDLVVVMEPGGACWDHDSCTGKTGIRGAANPDGIPDGHWSRGELTSPFLIRVDGEVPTQDWNQLYIPYCTGDVHSGNRVATYVDPRGESPDVTFHHVGHSNTAAVIDWLNGQFNRVPRLLVTGCSAGGTGALSNYYFFRTRMPSVERGYLLDDSGPIFPSGGYSDRLHDQIRSAWNLDSLLVDLPPSFDPDDFGTVNTALATEFPDDRIATTYFRRDYNYSLYSYERFYDLPPASDPAFKREIHRMWDADTTRLMADYDRHHNLAYYIPYWREFNDSHCTTLVGFTGSEIQDAGLGMSRWLFDFLDDDQPLVSAIEAPVAGEDAD